MKYKITIAVEPRISEIECKDNKEAIETAERIAKQTYDKLNGKHTVNYEIEY